MELPEDIFSAVNDLCEEGNDLSASGTFRAAIEKWRSALALLPEPADKLDAATWLHASIGDAHYQLNKHAEAIEALYDALNCPDGHCNPFVHYMLGRSLLRVGDAKGADQLLQAYMPDGEDFFLSDEEEGEACLRVLSDAKLIPT
jgi:tetratricopeptide (TPR) repeat protein